MDNEVKLGLYALFLELVAIDGIFKILPIPMYAVYSIFSASVLLISISFFGFLKRNKSAKK